MKPRGVSIKCDFCKTHLEVKNIGYVRTAKGHRTFECRRCHAHRTRRFKVKKLAGSWLSIA